MLSSMQRLGSSLLLSTRAHPYWSGHLEVGTLCCTAFSFRSKLASFGQGALCRGEIRTTLQRGLELCDRLINPFLSQISPAQIVTSLEEVRIEPHRFSKAGNRVGDFALQRQRLAQ